MKKTIRLTLIIVLIASAGLIFFYRMTSGGQVTGPELTEARQGSFEISLTGTGELTPEVSTDIRGPNIIRNRYFRIRPVKITDLVPEGIMVKKGDYVATLDRSNYDNSLKDEVEKLNQLQSEYEMKLLDTAMVMNSLRDEIKNQHFSVEGAEIAMAESRYEPPATQRRLAIELEKQKRMLGQQMKLYSLNRAQTSLETRKLYISLRDQREKVQDLRDLLASFTITSPADGMIAYRKDRTGLKIKTGSMWNPFDPVIATLPDLSGFDSKTYISEIDVNKVKKNQPVVVGIDAFHGKSFRGQVAEIANIGELLPNSDSKVFEVVIRLNETDPSLKPSMTTTNKIIMDTFDNVVYVPLEAVHAGPDSIPFVYTKSRKRQVVVPGRSNDKNIIVEKGLDPGTTVYLEVPEKSEKFELAGADLIPEIRERNKARRAEFEPAVKEPKTIAESARSSPE